MSECPMISWHKNTLMYLRNMCIVALLPTYTLISIFVQWYILLHSHKCLFNSYVLSLYIILLHRSAIQFSTLGIVTMCSYFSIIMLWRITWQHIVFIRRNRSLKNFVCTWTYYPEDIMTLYTNTRWQHVTACWEVWYQLVLHLDALKGIAVTINIILMKY